MNSGARTGELGGERRIFVDPWAPEYGSANQLDEADDDLVEAVLVEGETFAFVSPTAPPMTEPLAFVDGRRRAEALLSQWIGGSAVPGLAGAYAVGAVLVLPGAVPAFSREIVRRVAIWADGKSGELPTVAGGWSWVTRSTAEGGPAAPLRKLQDLMRDAEADLARELAAEGYLVLTDGTLWFPTGENYDRIAGYVKTHHRRLLPSDCADRLPELPAGQRTTLISTGRRYSCYLRLVDRPARHAPLSGIVRLEFDGSLPLDDVRSMADQFTKILPAYAGVAHVDPRAPQNLQPVSALESRLSHLCGDPGLALRAVRDAVAAL